jgi:thiamine biosynthesis lipoprotein
MRPILLIVLSSMLLAACGDESLLPTYDLSGNTMGTTFNIMLVAPPSSVDLDALQGRVYEQLERLENIASTYRPQSEISRFNASSSTDWVAVTPEFCEMVAAALELGVATHGAFDITVGPLVDLWGFGPAAMTNELPTADELASARTNVGGDKLDSDCERPALRKETAGLAIDLSAWAKGFAVDELATLLDAASVDNYLVEIGGELRIRGHNAEQEKFAIAVEKPMLNKEMAYEIVRLTNVAVATSGDYRNYYTHDGQRYSHTIDPRTGRPVTHNLTGVTVVSDSTAYADAMATALLVLGPEDGQALAEKLGLASYFLVRTGDGLEERQTTRFAALRKL